MFGGRGFRGFVLIAIGKMEILATFPHLQDDIKVIRRYEGVVVKVDSRCFCDGFYGTVRYIGEVPPSNGEWLGIEWDDPTRGKHSGVHEGVQFFTCSKPNSASFVRSKKLHFGYTFQEALEKRYSFKEIDGEKVDLVIGECDTSVGKKVEIYGTNKLSQKLSQYDQLTDVSLRDMLLSSAGIPGDIHLIAPSITDLNLSQNLLLSSWSQIADMTVQLPLLKTLVLSENRLSIPDNLVKVKTVFHTIQVLYLNKMDLQWTEFSCVLTFIPCIQELHVCENRISTLRSVDGETLFPESLKLLNLEENQLTDWMDILTLQNLPHLQTLILNDNHLSSISIMNESSFSNLQSLSLNKNKIMNWSSVDNLSQLKNLRSLNFKDNLLLEGEPSYSARQLIIARMQHITGLNRSDISNHERQQAERYYIKRHAAEWMLAEEKHTTRDFLYLHPQYHRLIQLHGLPEEIIQNQTSTAPLKNRLIAVTITCPDRTDLPQLNKKLPDTMTVQKLKGLLQRVYKIDSLDQVLSYRSHKTIGKDNTEIMIDDDLKQLSFYSIESGDTILLRT